MALKGTGSATSGWGRPLYLTSAAYPITLSCWVFVPGTGTNVGLWGLTGANAMNWLDYLIPPTSGTNQFLVDFYDDTGAEMAFGGALLDPQVNPDGKWHHVAWQILSGGVNPTGGKSTRIWIDGTEVGDSTGQSPGLGTQTTTAIQIGVAPTDGAEPVFDTTYALAELAVFTPGPTTSSVESTIKALASGASPLRVPGRLGLRAYHPLRTNFQDYVGSRTGFAPVGTPIAPVWIAHPPLVDPLPLSIRRLQVTHVAAQFVGTGGSTDTGTGALTNAIVLTGTGSDTQSATGTLLASALQASSTLSRNSATGALTAATHLVGTGASSDTGLGALFGSGIPLAAVASSTDTAVGSLTIPSIAANAQQLQNALIDTLMRGQPFLAPATWFVALVTQVGDTVTAGIEVSGSGYARVAVAASLTAWSGTQGAGTTIASTGISGMVSNNAAIVFPTATGDWSTVVGYEFWDQPSGGNRWFSGKLGSAVTILNGQTRRFPVAALSVAIN